MTDDQIHDDAVTKAVANVDEWKLELARANRSKVKHRIEKAVTELDGAMFAACVTSLRRLTMVGRNMRHFEAARSEAKEVLKRIDEK